MSCPLAHDGAAFVLGALPSGERLEFERHLADCGDCTRAVRELAGLPGLLSRVDASVLEHPPADQPVPDTLLPALSREVRRGRRRRTFAAAGLAAAVAAALAVGVPVVVNQVDHGDGSSPSATAASARPGGIVTRPMAPVGDVPVRATLAMEQVTWGTRLLLTCTYEPQSVTYDLPPAAEYTLVVRSRGHRTEQVGSWLSVGGKTMHVAAATSAGPADIASVEVRTPDGRVVLRLGA